MADVILIQPKIGSMDSIRSNPAPPLSLLHAAVYVNKEYKICLIDQRLNKNWKSDLENELKKQPLCVALTAMTGRQIKYALSASTLIKQKSNIPVVWGGIHSSLLPEQTLKNPNIDFVIQGEGELTFLELVKALKNKTQFNKIDGLWYKKSGKIKKNNLREFINVDSLPEIPYHLVDMQKYMPKYNGKKLLYLYTSRGCPHRCTHCYNNIYNRKKYRAQSAEKTLKRIEFAKTELKPDAIYFVDDNIFSDIKRAKKILKGLKKSDLYWQSQGVEISTVNKMSEEFLKLINDSGCLRLAMGGESGSQKILNLINKKHTVNETIAVNKKLSHYNFIAFYNFIGGFPTETTKDLKKTINLIFELMKQNKNCRISPIYNFVPYPCTELAEYSKSIGYIPPSKLEDWIDYDWKISMLPFSKEKKEFMASLYTVSLFLDKKFHEYDVPGVIRLLAELYRPFARLRVKNLFFRFMIEKEISKFFKAA